nr:TonB-dependent receptor [Pseudomonas palleroniana]
MACTKPWAVVGNRCTRSKPRSAESYSVYDANLSYDLGQSPLQLKGVKLAMNVQNLTNKTYVSQCTGDLDCYYGEGRTVVSSLTYDW